MKTTFSTLALLIFLGQLGFACTFTPRSFCSTASTHESNLIVSGYITSIDEDGIDFEIIQLIRGEESKQNIRIWDGSDFDCNGPFSMAASDFGNVGDSLVLILPIIESMENTWDIIGDYRRPESYLNSPILKIENNLVSGFVYGSPYNPRNSFDFESFVNSFEDLQNCDNIVSTKELKNTIGLNLYPNPFTSDLNVELEDNSGNVSIEIFDIRGKSILRKELSSSFENVSTEQLPAGLFILTVTKENKLIARKRIAKTSS